jgi:hypothetical protein
MKFEDALKKIKNVESVGGQLIAHRSGRNVLVGKNVQGTLIVEDDQEARGIVLEVDKKGVEEGRIAEADADDKSILATHPVEQALHPTEPMPNMDADDAPDVASAQEDAYDEESAGDTYKAPKGADKDQPQPNTAETSGDKAGQEAKRLKEGEKDERGKTHDLKAEDKVEVKDQTSSKK